MTQEKNNDPVTMPKQNFYLFWVILLIIPLIFFVFLEFGLRIGDYGDDLTLFKQGKDEYSKYMYINRWVAKRYFRNTNIIPDPSNDVFMTEKPENGYRIFVLGGSTAAGWPYSNNIMFSRILQKRLADTYPDKYIEVVNTSISAINSYAQLDFSDEILDYDPDLILIYSGHNEFYGSLGVASTQSIGSFRWIKNLYLYFVQFKTFQLLNNSIKYLYSLVASSPDSVKEDSSPMMEEMVGDSEIELDSDLYNEGIDQFETNLKDIIDEFENAGIPVILSEIVSNWKGLEPFVSIKNPPGNNAKELFKEAVLLERINEFEKARAKYIEAKDNDALRFRGPEEINNIINDIGEKKGLPVVKMKSQFEQSARNGIIGNDLMLDHLHPTIDGYFLMADAFYNEIVENKLVSANKIVEDLKSSLDYQNEWGYSGLDSVYAQMKINYLKSGWPFTKSKNRLSSQNIPLKNILDRIALRVWKDRMYTSEDGHLELANYFEARNLHESAFNEYNALSCLKPLNNSAFLKAADASIKAGNLKRALPFLEHSLTIEKTAFAYKWIGLINLDLGNLDAAIVNLKKVYDLDLKDPEILYNLGLAYVEKENYQSASIMLEDLKELKIENNEISTMITVLQKLLKSRPTKG